MIINVIPPTSLIFFIRFIFPHYTLFPAKQKPEIFTLGCWLPSSKLIIILENRDYMTMLKEKLLEIKRGYRSLKLSPTVAI